VFARDVLGKRRRTEGEKSEWPIVLLPVLDNTSEHLKTQTPT